MRPQVYAHRAILRIRFALTAILVLETLHLRVID